MKRSHIACLLASTVLVLGMHLPPDDPPPRPPGPRTCDWVLIPQADSGGCYSAGNPDCTGNGSGPPCCLHFHLPLNWNRAVRWFKTTGTTKGPKTKKYYQSIDSRCIDTQCVAASAMDDSLHYQTEDTLVGCDP